MNRPLEEKQPHVLIVEDEADLAHLLADYVSASGFTFKIFHSGEHVIEYCQEHTPDLMLLDIQLPVLNGFEICKELRTFSDLPVVFITSRVDESERLKGLELGADDYICKPFSPKEVVARIKAILRRANKSTVEHQHNIFLDEDKLLLSIYSNKVELTKTEANLFSLLYNEPGKIFGREQIVDKIYSDYRVVSNRTVDSHIKKLRKKIVDAYPEKELIVSIYGVGYKYEDPSA